MLRLPPLFRFRLRRRQRPLQPTSFHPRQLHNLSAPRCPSLLETPHGSHVRRDSAPSAIFISRTWPLTSRLILSPPTDPICANFVIGASPDPTTYSVISSATGRKSEQTRANFAVRSNLVLLTQRTTVATPWVSFPVATPTRTT